MWDLVGNHIVGFVLTLLNFLDPPISDIKRSKTDQTGRLTRLILGFVLCLFHIVMIVGCFIIEPRYEKTGFLRMRNQRRRSASR